MRILDFFLWKNKDRCWILVGDLYRFKVLLVNNLNIHINEYIDETHRLMAVILRDTKFVVSYKVISCIYVCNIHYFFFHVVIELFVHIMYCCMFDLYTPQILEEIKNIIIII